MLKNNRLGPALPTPDFYNPEAVGRIWNVPYQIRAEGARAWAKKYQIQPASSDSFKIGLLAIDLQNSFCLPDFELFVAGRSGMGAVQDNQRLSEFIYHNLASISHISATLDTHQAMQIFHPVFLIDAQGHHPAPHTLVSHEDILESRWSFNPEIAANLGITAEYGQEHLLHYTQELKKRHKYALTVWPYHVMLGSIGHALTPAIEEAIFFHTMARYSQAEFEIKGSNPLTEHYSALGPEVLHDRQGEMIAQKDTQLLQLASKMDILVIAGQAKSHCVAWTIEDLLDAINQVDADLARKIYLLEDCTSPVVVPGVVDYTQQADEAFQKFAAAGMHLVKSTDPIQNWPGIRGQFSAS